MLQTIGPGEALVAQVVTAMVKTNPHPGSRVRDTERNEARHLGRIEGWADCLAWRANELRMKELRPYIVEKENARRVYETLSSHTFRTWLNTVRERWDLGDFKGTSDTEFYALMQEEFDALWLTDEFMQTALEWRKSAIKAGAVEPDKRDADWIAEELNAMLAVANPYQQLLDKINKAPYVNDATGKE